MQNKVSQSETVVIKRSEINPADYNPRKLSDEARKKLKANIKANGLIGGLVYNEETKNLVSGHQRLSIADEINKYNPETKENDYDIKLEQISVDLKKEKELNIWFNSTSVQGTYDYSKLALMIPDIDVNLAGLDEVDISMVEIEMPTIEDIVIPTFEPQQDKKIAAEIENGKHDEQNTEETTGNNEGEETEKSELSAEEKKAAVKAIKEKVKNAATYEGEPYFTVSFDSYENKAFFLERFQIGAETRFIKGEELAEKLDGL